MTQSLTGARSFTGVGHRFNFTKDMDKTRLAVLVVDDEPALREVLSLRIADWGYDVRMALYHLML